MSDDHRALIEQARREHYTLEDHIDSKDRLVCMTCRVTAPCLPARLAEALDVASGGARTPGCIGGCSYGLDGVFYHHVYCQTYGSHSVVTLAGREWVGRAGYETASAQIGDLQARLEECWIQRTAATAAGCDLARDLAAAERDRDSARRALEVVLPALEWMDSWGQSESGMRTARTLHYDMAGKATTLLPVVRAALAPTKDPTP